ncbi:hypothetical protein Patl1_15895 [Pistacia atlantica]|uniref:Uncharacterized protein n=1 Tax=Pistacia atlantica TaxID=434234 RepID=A0ACC1B849_9ROSI|nr:hypothetical protein Patl1_15895 [Pistacia atlantica]
MVTELLAPIITETRADSQEETLPGKELHGSKGLGILQDPLQSYTVADLSKDSNCLRVWDHNGYLMRVALVGLNSKSNPREPQRKRKQRKFEKDDLRKAGKKSKLESCATKVGEVGVDAIPAEDDDLSAVAVEQHSRQP